MKERVVVGMSGGIDSFVTALLLQQQGYEVVGVNLVLWKENDLTEAENICRRLGIPLVVRHGESLFRQWVIDPFVAGYTAGQTPSPCCVCNSYVKWELLHQAAEELGASWIATGHYVRQVEIDGRYYIRCGVDPVKDQSYFLWGIPQHILAKALTPLGDYLKSEVKAWALAHGYERMAKRRESMGVCFLQGCDYRSFVRGQRGRGDVPGDILDLSGRVIGRHDGLLNYTVGQKRGLPSPDGRLLYVKEMDVTRNVLVAGSKADLWTDTLCVEQVRLVDSRDLQGEVKVKIRGLGLNPEGPASFESLPGQRLRIRLSHPAWAVAPGQPVAFFREDVLVGGGIACRPI